MAAKIKVLVVDDIQATRDSIRKLLDFHPEITLAGEAKSAEEAISVARAVQPDVILMDVNMPAMDGITATAILAGEVPAAAIIIMSVQGEQEYLRRAMIAGAKDYLTKPFTGDELLTAIKQVHANEQRRRSKVVAFGPRAPEPGKIITIFSTKGGVGKTTIAANLAVALQQKTGERVGVVDADLQFGDIALFLNLLPRVTVADLARESGSLDESILEGYFTAHGDGVRVLAAPLRPEQAETVTGAHITAILKAMRSAFKYTIVDTSPAFSEHGLAALDMADIVLVVASLDLPTIKNVKLGLEILDSLEYSPEKVRLVLNRTHSEGGMDIREAEESLRRPFVVTLPSDGKTVVASVNRGIPFVVSNPDTAVAQSIFSLARSIAGGECQEQAPATAGVVGRLRRMFG
jgi:pilus assembly protein CpaE